MSLNDPWETETVEVRLPRSVASLLHAMAVSYSADESYADTEFARQLKGAVQPLRDVITRWRGVATACAIWIVLELALIIHRTWKSGAQ